MLKSRLPQIAATLDTRIDAAVKAGAELIESDAKSRAPDAPPIGEGLVAAIHTEPQDGGYAVIAGDDDTFYGHFLEFGTTHSAAQPFLLPALEARKDEAVALVAASLRRL